MAGSELKPLDAAEIGVVTTPAQRDGIFAVRMIVFVGEQAVPAEEELDAYDDSATHFFVRLPVAQQDETARACSGIIATARLLDKGNGLAKIGRVAVLQPYRKHGVGTELMRQIEAHAKRTGYQWLALEAQCHAIAFYERLGYAAEGDVFLDAGIEHRLMKKVIPGPQA